MSANSLDSTDVFSSKSQISDINNDIWEKESNLVEAPEPTSMFWQVFEKPRMQKFTENYMKNIVRALYKFDSLHKRQQKTIPRTEEQEFKYDTKTTQMPTFNSQPTNKVSTEGLTSPIPPAVEELSDIVLHLPSQMEVDKSQKFTHSIRYGYGKSPF